MTTPAWYCDQSELSHARLSSSSVLGHVAAAELIGVRLELAGAEHVDVDRQLVDQALEERAVVTEAVDEHEPLRIEIDLVGLRGEVVLRLVEAFAVRDTPSCRWCGSRGSPRATSSSFATPPPAMLPSRAPALRCACPSSRPRWHRRDRAPASRRAAGRTAPRPRARTDRRRAARRARPAARARAPPCAARSECWATAPRRGRGTAPAAR